MQSLCDSITSGNRQPGRWRWAVLLMGLGLGSLASAATLEDYFTNRLTFTSVSGSLEVNNAAAGVELNEPKHGGKPGGHSMWLSWVAPSNCVVEFKTETSRFDTLLAAYRFISTNDTTFDKLQLVAGADDSEGFERESEIEFGATAGERYEIAVDGYNGATGKIELQWKSDLINGAPPVLVSTPTDSSAKMGDPVQLVVNLTNLGAAELKWYFDGNELSPIVTTTNLLIPSFQVTNVGRYKLRVSVDGQRYFLPPTEVQINTDGATNTLARGKFLDALESGLIGSGEASRPAFGPRPLGPGGGTGVVRGYNGSQIFNTTYATVDTNEPPHCEISGGTSYWLIYQPPTNGTITLDTVGSGYDTVIEVYTFNGALTGYQDLISIACDNDGVGPNGASRVQFAVVRSRQYIVAVEGVNGARGTAWLNYSLNTSQPPTAPKLLAPPDMVAVAEGSPATLAPSLAGAPPLRFAWKKNATPLPGVNSPGIFFPSTTNSDTADYVVTVTNDLGSLTATQVLRVLIAPACALTGLSNSLQLSFATIMGQHYTVEEAAEVIGPWQPWPRLYLGDNQPLFLKVTNGGTKFYRVRVE